MAAKLPALPHIPLSYMIAGGAILAAVFYIKTMGAKKVGTDVASGAVDLVTGVVEGGVVSIGEAVGIPQTNQTECDKARAEGRTWDASFACPAGDFLGYVWDKTTGSATSSGGASGSW